VSSLNELSAIEASRHKSRICRLDTVVVFVASVVEALRLAKGEISRSLERKSALVACK